jgi:hypothetical protein
VHSDPSSEKCLGPRPPSIQLVFLSWEVRLGLEMPGTICVWLLFSLPAIREACEGQGNLPRTFPGLGLQYKSSETQFSSCTKIVSPLMVLGPLCGFTIYWHLMSKGPGPLLRSRVRQLSRLGRSTLDPHLSLLS